MKRLFLFTLLFFLFVCSNAFSNEGPVFTPTPRPNIQSAIKSSKLLSVKMSIPDLDQLQSRKATLGTTPIDMTLYPPGWYILQVIAGEKVTEIKIIKQ